MDRLVEIVGVVTRSSSKDYFHAFFMSSLKANAMTDPGNIHIGHMIKSVFDKSGMTVSELARRLHCERTNVYTIFKRRTVDVELLAKISKVLGHNFLEEAMIAYGLIAPISPKFSINITLEELGAEQLDFFKQMIAKLKENA